MARPHAPAAYGPAFSGGMADGGAIRIGTAGWSVRGHEAGAAPATSSHLERYAQIFQAAEINSSFYKPHRPQTYARSAASVPGAFRFAVKLPKEITHTRRLIDAGCLLDRFVSEVSYLGDRLGPLLVQLPPSLVFSEDTAIAFLAALRKRFDGDVVCEPRHATWFGDAADAVLARARVARVAADPAPVPSAAAPGGWTGLVYRRLHGSPVMYSSSYGADYVEGLAGEMRRDVERGVTSWCIFDNTMHGAAIRNAAQLAGMLPFDDFQ